MTRATIRTLLLVCVAQLALANAAACVTKGGESQPPADAACSWRIARSGSLSGCASAGGTKVSCSVADIPAQYGFLGAPCALGFDDQACGPAFCLNRVLLNRWKWIERSDDEQDSEVKNRGEYPQVAHCSYHCEVASDCGPGFSCCEPRPEAFCLLRRAPGIEARECAEPCADNYLGCSGDTVCCEKLGKVCVSSACSGVCPS